MAFPTGSGSERLKYTKIAALTNTNQALITGVALHIYTVVSIIWCEEGNQANELINLLITEIINILSKYFFISLEFFLTDVL